MRDCKIVHGGPDLQVRPTTVSKFEVPSSKFAFYLAPSSTSIVS
jgi:hypothetical protein